MKLFKQTHTYDEAWPTVTLAFFLRYPNPYASHVLSCDVLSRVLTPHGTLLTTRLILKRGAIPKWMPKGIVSRAESWIIEESEVDTVGKVVRCSTQNLDHVKILSVRESVVLKEGSHSGTTAQITEARVVSKFGWGLARRIERYGHEKFQRNIERSRAGISLVLSLLHQSRLQALSYDNYPIHPVSNTGTVFDSFRPRAIHSSASPRASNADRTDPDRDVVAPLHGNETPHDHVPSPKWYCNPRTWFR